MPASLASDPVVFLTSCVDEPFSFLQIEPGQRFVSDSTPVTR